MIWHQCDVSRKLYRIHDSTSNRCLQRSFNWTLKYFFYVHDIVLHSYINSKYLIEYDFVDTKSVKKTVIIDTDSHVIFTQIIMSIFIRNLYRFSWWWFARDDDSLFFVEFKFFLWNFNAKLLSKHVYCLPKKIKKKCSNRNAMWRWFFVIEISQHNIDLVVAKPVVY